jgi:hypothetical protein
LPSKNTFLEIMGKGSNVQKAQAARERNQKKMGKSEEERKAASAKAAKDAAAFCCGICRQTFMVNSKLPLLYLHVTAKHSPEEAAQCFSQLAGYDPNNPDGAQTGGSSDAAKKAEAAKKKKAAASAAGLDDLLNAGLTKTTKRKPGQK